MCDWQPELFSNATDMFFFVNEMTVNKLINDYCLFQNSNYSYHWMMFGVVTFVSLFDVLSVILVITVWCQNSYCSYHCFSLVSFQNFFGFHCTLVLFCCNIFWSGFSVSTITLFLLYFIFYCSSGRFVKTVVIRLLLSQHHTCC